MKLLSLFFSIIFSLILITPTFAHYNAKYEPPDGKIYHGSGWNHIDSQHNYENIFPAGYAPLILQSNISIPGTRGFDVARGVQALTRNIVHPDSQFCEFSMHWQGRDALVMLDSIYVHTDEWDHWVDTLEIVFRQIDRPFFFRIGFEFNGSWNPYHPYIFPVAFRKLVEDLRERGIDNFATVWCYEPDAPGDFADSSRAGWKWYPGDDVVDWFGLDLFKHEHFDPAEPDSAEGRNGWNITRKGRSEAFLRFAEQRGKPVYLSELSAIDIEAIPDSADVDSADGRHDWELWFEPFFEFVDAHPIIKGWNYINLNWNVVGHYGEMGWRDARLEINSYIRNRWMSRLMDERFINAGYDIAQPVSVPTEKETIPIDFDFSVFPNPFNSSFRIGYKLTRGTQVKLTIYSLNGVEVWNKPVTDHIAGDHQIFVNGTDLASGVYLVMLKTNYAQVAQKIVLIR